VSGSFFIFSEVISLFSRRFYVGLLKVFDVCHEDFWWLNWRYLIGALEIFDGYDGDIWRVT